MSPAPTDAPAHAYDPAAIEARWQEHWEQHKTFRAPGPGDDGFDSDKPKFYVLDMFPYPSGVGLHVGHPLGYIATDIVGRYRLMRGDNVLHPMGFDAFGLPAEQYAVEHNVHPRITTQANIDNMVRQLRKLGLGYDWDRTLATTDPGYVKWTQWIFLQMYGSYFDPIEKAARPIDQLVEKLQGEDYLIGLNGELIYSGSSEDIEALSGGIIGARKWHSLEADQQRRLLDEYRLAYLADIEVNWCPGLGTVLANEEVKADGRSERGNMPVYKRPLKQWMLRITAYADRLADDLDGVKWPAAVKALQRNWIGRSEGANVTFTIDPADADAAPDDHPLQLEAYTTRPDTLFGATYMVVAPEHPLLSALTTDAQREAVTAYRAAAAAKTDLERKADGKSKSGVFTGSYAVNPVNGARIPVWTADYVLTGYGTGAIMAVPAHDQRDHDFARAFDLPIVQVIDAPMQPDLDIQAEAWTGDGKLINSHDADRGLNLNNLSFDEAKARVTQWLEHHGTGTATTRYKLRDWLFSRQRYWGEPFPILHAPDGTIVPLDESELPLELPEMQDFKPSASDSPDDPPAPPLGRAPVTWRKVIRDGIEYSRELNTMPNWAGSCWYYLRYLDPSNRSRLVGEAAESYWMRSTTADGTPHNGGVDLYVGGVEHAVLHLLYARFWHKVLYDLGHVGTPEPFGRYFAQGYIQAFYYETEEGVRVEAGEVVDADTGLSAAAVQDRPDDQLRLEHDGRPVKRLYGKMGKSLKNAVAPDDVISQYGCDTLRLYEMYMGPLEASKVWNTQDIVGVHRFLNRLWRNLVDDSTGVLRVSDEAPDTETERATHQAIARVTDAMEKMAFNVAIAALIELNNALVRLDTVPRFTADALTRMLGPLAPHLAEELWHRLGHTDSIAREPWPEHDPDKLAADTVELPVQVNGKLRGRVTIPADADNAAAEAAARADANVAEHLARLDVKKVIVIPGKLINFAGKPKS